MAFEYRPFVNPYISSMTDLMGQGTEARSRAELSAAEAEAGGQLRLGDLTQQKWSGLGNTLAGGIDDYVTERREAPIREEEARLRGLNIGVAEQQLAAGEVEAAQGEQERQRDTTRDRILATAQTRFTGPNGEVDAEGATAWVQEQFALQLPPSYLEAYQVRQRATEEHDALIASHAARVEEANLGTQARGLEIERAEESDRLFKEMTRIDDTHGLGGPESDAAHRAYYGYTRTTDPLIAIREARKDRQAETARAAARTSTEIARDRTFLIDNYKGALASRDPAVIHAAEQALYQERIDPRTVRQGALQESYDEAVERHNLRVGTPGGMYANAGREEMDNFDTWLQEANIPDVSTLGSVYAPPPESTGLPSELDVATHLAERWGVSVEEAIQIIKNEDAEAPVPPVTPSPIGLGSGGGGYGVYSETAGQIPLSIPNPLAAFGAGRTRAQEDSERLRRERATRSTGPS
jgi:hypothetical protein|tara:strand:+ start:1793 stop:3193 length:1401 start_codon:yes stop_codon:yes gene_type:complete